MMMRNLALSVLFTVLSLSLLGEKLQLPVTAEGAILINASTGTVLFEKNAQMPLYPASITKIATALYTLVKKENQLEERVIASRESVASISPEAKRQSNYRCPAYWLETDGSHIAIKRGEELLLKDLLHGLLIASANDAANVIAEHVGGSIPKFMEELNAYLKKLGCKNTHFVNPHGLHHPQQLSSAYDMALIAKEAMKYPLFREIVAKTRHTIPRSNLEPERTLVQTNLLLRKGRYYYPQAVGIKTGTTSAAGKALVASACEGDRYLIAVVMGCQKMGERYEDAIALFDTAFSEKKMRRYLISKGLSPLTKRVLGANTVLKTELAEGLYYDYYPTEEQPVKAYTKWIIPTLPIEKGQCVAVVRVVDAKGAVLQEVPLLAAEKLTPSLLYRLKNALLKEKSGKRALFVIAFAAFVWLFLKRRKGKTKQRRRSL